MNARSERLVSFLLFGGVCAIVLGGFMFCMFAFAGIGQAAGSHGRDQTGIAIAVLFLLVALAGIVMIVVGLIMGFNANRGMSASKVRNEPSVKVRSRFATNEIGEMIFGNFEYDAPGGKLFVQLQFPDGHVEELNTAWGVFCQCGEGMNGAAMIKGDWLASFAPIVIQADPLRNPQL